MEEHHLEIRKTARYFQSGELNDSTREIWIVCHGYAQLANFFLKKFDSLIDEHRCIIAPEGLHRFYLSGNSGRVVASWMTKEDRLNDIKDYVAYLDQIAKRAKEQAPNARLMVLGFSQGCATVTRWIGYGQTSCDALILYAGVFPPDLNFELNGDRLRHTRLIITCGDQDEFLDEQAIQNQLHVLQEKAIPFRFIPFSGGHRIYPDTLNKIGAELL